MAGFDIIKQYLISIGFNLDENSMNNAENKMNAVDKEIRNSQKQNQQEFNNSSNVLKNLFELISTTPEIKNFFPSSIRGDLTDVLKKINQINNLNLNNVLSKLFPSSIRGDLTDVLKKINQINNLNLNNVLSKLFPPKSETEPNESLERIKNGISKFTEQGSKDILKFSGTSIMAFASIAIALKGYVCLIEGTISLLKDLSEKDIGYEKLSRQLWITKENAREVNKALDTMGVSLEDLWLSPTLLKQFNQLRQDSKDLKLPDDYNENLKIIQQIGTEFARTKQMGTIAFEWIGNSIMKNCRGPLEEIMEMMYQGNSWLKDKLPVLANSAGVYIGNAIRPLADGIYVTYTIGEKAIGLYEKIKEKIQVNEKINDTFQKTKSIIENTNFPFLRDIKLVATTFEDLASYFRTGNSPMMDYFSKIKDKLSFIKIPKIFDDDDKNVKQSSDNNTHWYDKIGNFLQSAKKSSFLPSTIPGLNSVKQGYELYQNYKGYNNATTTNNKNQDNSKINSENTVTNYNSFTVSGNDAHSNATAIGTTMNSIITRSLG